MTWLQEWFTKANAYMRANLRITDGRITLDAQEAKEYMCGGWNSNAPLRCFVSPPASFVCISGTARASARRKARVLKNVLSAGAEFCL